MARVFTTIAAALLALAASTTAARQAGNLTTGCVTKFDPAADYFPDKVQPADSANFTVEYRRAYKLVSVKEAAAVGTDERYVLLQCGAPRAAVPAELQKVPVIEVPVKSLFAYSTTHVALLVDLGRVDVLTGVAQLSDITSAAVLERIKSGKVAEFASNQLEIDAERVVAGHPSVLMVTTGAMPVLAVVRNAGIPVAVDTEWLERTPLARAEWVKFMALFLNEERKAQTVYAGLKARYGRLTAATTALPASSRPLVMTGRSERGVFTVAGGRGYVASLIKDAGARYVWDDNLSTGIVSVDLEAQLRRGRDADFWINGYGWHDLRSMLAEEPRYAEFKAFRAGQIWVYDLRASSAKTYWSGSVTHPDILLSDLIKIFHPSLVPNHVSEWYVRVPR